MTPAQTRALLTVLSAECADMGAAVDGLSALVFEHARRLPAAERPEVVVQAQAVDLLAQKLAALAVFAQALAADRPVEQAIEAIPLADLSDRLHAGMMGSGRGSAAVASDGELVLFD